jgi:hypothetical protein
MSASAIDNDTVAYWSTAADAAAAASAAVGSTKYNYFD